MKFKAIHSRHIDIAKWNTSVDSSEGEVYNEYHYLCGVTMNNWYGLVWGDYEKILPVYKKKKWHSIPYVCMPPFCQKFDNRSLTAAEFAEAMGYLQRRSFLVDYCVMESKGIANFIPKTNYILHKNFASYEALHDKYSSLLKKNLKNRDAIAMKTMEIEEVIVWFENQPLFQKLIGMKYRDAFLSLTQMTAFRYRAAIDAHSGEVIAILGSISYRDTEYLLFPFTNDLGRKRHAMSHLIDSIVRDPSIQHINFEGSSIDSIAHFYQQFGAEIEHYYSLKYRKFRPL
jgi:hypothetical protein